MISSFQTRPPLPSSSRVILQWFLLFSVLLLWLIHGNAAPSCVPYDSTIGTTFKGVIADGTLIYIDGTRYHNLTQIESSASQAALGLAGFTNTSCIRDWGNLMAASYYLQCDAAQWTNNGVALPRLPCASVCQRTVASCRGVDQNLVNILYLGYFLCTASNKLLPGLGLPDYPVKFTNFSDGSATLCNEASYTMPNYGRCEVYTGSVCAGVLPSGGYHYIPAGRCQSSLESILSALPTLLAALQPSCAEATSVLLCNSAFLRCDNTSLAQQLTSFTFSGFGTLPGIAVPRFVHRSACESWLASCPSSTDRQWLATFAANGDLGFTPNLADDYTKMAVLLGSALPVCDSIGVNAPGDNPDYPTNATIFASVNAMPFGTLVLSTQPFVPNTTNITYSIARCLPFDSAAIIAGMPLYQPDGSLRTDTPASYCQGIVNEGDMIYVPAGSTLSTLNDQIRQVHWLFGVMPTTNDCMKAFYRYACFQAFNPCDGTQLHVTYDVAPNVYSGDYTTRESRTINITSAFPRLPCSDVCYDFATRCADFIATTPELAPNCTKRTLAPNGNTPDTIKITNCDGTTSGQSQLDFPTSTTWFTAVTWPPTNITADATYGISTNTSITVNGVTLPVIPMSITVQTQCGHNETTDINMFDVQLFCLHPTISPYQTGATTYDRGGDIQSGANFYINDGSCSVKCPPPIYTHARIQAVWGFYRTFTVISWLLLLSLIITYMKFRERRERQLLFCFLLCCFLASTSGLFSVFQDPFHQLCNSEGQDAQQNGRPKASCSAQGAMFQVTVLACVLWWACQGVDIFLQLIMTRRWLIQNKRRLNIVYHLIAWPLPIITGILGLAFHTYGQVGALAFCTWSSVATGYIWAVFYAPVLVSLIVGAVCMLTVIFTLIRSAKATLQDARAQFRLVIRPMAFISIFFFIFIIVFAQTIYQSTNREGIFINVFEWVRCKLVATPKSYFYDPYHNTTEPPGSFDNCGEVPERPPAFGLYVGLHLAISCQGILMFLNYGTEYRNWQLWRDWYRAKRNKSRGEGSHGARSGSGSKGTAQTSRGHASTATTGTNITRQGSVGATSRHGSHDQQDLMKGVRMDGNEPLVAAGATPSSPNLSGGAGAAVELDAITEETPRDRKKSKTRKQSTAAEMFAAELETERKATPNRASIVAAANATNNTRSSIIGTAPPVVPVASSTPTSASDEKTVSSDAPAASGARVSVSAAPASPPVSDASASSSSISPSGVALESIDSSVTQPSSSLSSSSDAPAATTTLLPDNPSS